MRRLLLIAVLLCAPLARASTCVATPASTHGVVTSNAINTTGSSILLGVISSFSGYNQVLNDSVSTTNWNTGQEYDTSGTGGGPFNQIVYKPAPTTSSSYTFTIPNPGFLFFQSATVWACSGTTTDHPLIQQTGIYTTGTSLTFQPGSVTPHEAGDLIFATLTCNTTTLTATIDSGFATPVVNNSTGNLATASTWLSASSTTPVNPTWTTNFAPCIASIAVFGATGATPPPDTGQHVITVVGTGFQSSGGDGGPATSAFVNYPGELVNTSSGLICFTDINNNRIRCFNPTGGTLTAPWVGSVSIAPGNIATVAGTGTLGFAGDGGPPLSAQFAHPVGLAIDPSDCLYIADQQNAEIRHFCPGGNVSTVAGGGGSTFTSGCHTTGQSRDVAGFSGDGGPATSAALRCPQSVAVDPGGTFFVFGDTNNDRVRVVNITGGTLTLFGVSVCAGCIQTILGQGTHNCHLTGTGTTTQVSWPIGVGLDSSNNLYVGALLCNSAWELTTGGVPIVVAGSTTFTGGYSGDGGLATNATMRNVFRINVAANGDYYITDTGNSAIRFVDHVSRNISTILGNFNLYPYYSPTTWNSGGYCCDNGAANVAGSAYPIGLHYNQSTNELYVSEVVNSRIRKLFTAGVAGVGSQFNAGSQFNGKSIIK